MQGKTCLLLALLLVCVARLHSAESPARKGDSTAESKKSDDATDKSDQLKGDRAFDHDEDEDEDVDDNSSALSSYADNRYTAYDTPTMNYRTRPRPSSSAGPAPVLFEDEPVNVNVNGRSRSPFGSFPSAMSFDNHAMVANSPTCHSLVDAQYPLFSDTCGAVPQARYALPNVFGHRERWQILQFLTALVGSSNDPACTRSLRLLVCPVLFPPCQSRFEPPAVLPCQSYCRAVKARCALPTLDLLPCEALPQSSDLCPTNQGYSSFLPTGPFPSAVPQSRPMNNGYGQSRSFSAQPSAYSAQPSAYSAQNSQTLTPSSPFNLFNGGQFGAETPMPTHMDYPSRSSINDPWQPPKYTPMTRTSVGSRTAPSSASNVKA